MSTFVVLLCFLAMACEVIGNQRLFVHFDDQRNEILRFTVNDSTWTTPVTNSSSQLTVGDIDSQKSKPIMLSSVKDIYSFIARNVDNLGQFELEWFDSKSGVFTPFVESVSATVAVATITDKESTDIIHSSNNSATDSSDRFSRTKMLRVLVRCKATSDPGQQLMAIDGRRFGDEPLVIGGRVVVVGELHNSDHRTHLNKTDASNNNDTGAGVKTDSTAGSGADGADAGDAGALAQGIDGDTGLQCWDSAFVLSKFLEKHKETYVIGKNILEIGSGTGIVSIVCQLLTEPPVDAPTPSQPSTYTTAAAVNGSVSVDTSNSNSSASIVTAAAAGSVGIGGGIGTVSSPLQGDGDGGVITVTDLPYTMPNIQANIRRNAVSTSSSSSGNKNTAVGRSRIEAFILDWNAPAELLPPNGDPESQQSQQSPMRRQYDVILCSDVIWLEHLIPALVNTLAYYGTPGASAAGTITATGTVVRAAVTASSTNTAADMVSATTPVILLAHQTRTLRADQQFFSLMHARGFCVSPLQKHEYHSDFIHLPKIQIYKLTYVGTAGTPGTDCDDVDDV